MKITIGTVVFLLLITSIACSAGYEGYSYQAEYHDPLTTKYTNPQRSGGYSSLDDYIERKRRNHHNSYPTSIEKEMEPPTATPFFTNLPFPTPTPIRPTKILSPTKTPSPTSKPISTPTNKHLTPNPTRQRKFISIQTATPEPTLAQWQKDNILAEYYQEKAKIRKEKEDSRIATKVAKRTIVQKEMAKIKEAYKDTFKIIGGWCYLTRRNSILEERGEYTPKTAPRIQYFTGPLGRFSVKCKPDSTFSYEICESNLNPKQFTQWYNTYGRIYLQEGNDEKYGCEQ